MALLLLRKLTFVALTLAFACILNDTVDAQKNVSPWQNYEQGRVRLVSAATSVNGPKLLLGLHFEIAPDWKIFWRSPGEAGYPARIDWSGSENILDPEILWPLPHRFEVLGLYTYGYKDEVLLPIVAAVVRSNSPVKLQVALDFLTCREVCVPHTYSLSLDLPSGDAVGSRSEHASLIDYYKLRVPSKTPNSAFFIKTASLVPTRKGQKLEVRAYSKGGFSNPDVFIEGAAGLQFGQPKVTISNEGQAALLDLPILVNKLSEENSRILFDQLLTFTLVDGDKGIEQTQVITLGGFVGAEMPSFYLALLFGLLGGLILNVMPCVLPILSIKLLSFVSYGEKSLKTVRLNFVSSAYGIIFTFFILGVFVFLLRLGGKTVGWGFHFQEPLFILCMIFILTLFTANLLGFFEFRLPGWINRFAIYPRSVENSENIVGSFFSGAFATILATPCSAPLVGTAVAFALTSTPLQIFSVFISLGVGMSLPFLTVAIFPSLIIWLPRPGPWMVIAKRFLALALIATTMWLLLIFAIQTGTRTAIVTASFMVIVLTVFWIFSHFMPIRSASRFIIILALLVGTFFFYQALGVSSGENIRLSTYWEKFDKKSIQGLIEEDKVVFVDITAEWCLTCKINKTFVLNRTPVSPLLKNNDVVAMQADWTNPDDNISGYLASFNRYGIPFNIVYGRFAPNGLVLPELLDSKTVVKAIGLVKGHSLKTN